MKITLSEKIAMHGVALGLRGLMQIKEHSRIKRLLINLEKAAGRRVRSLPRVSPADYDKLDSKTLMFGIKMGWLGRKDMGVCIAFLLFLFCEQDSPGVFEALKEVDSFLSQSDDPNIHPSQYKAQAAAALDVWQEMWDGNA